MTTRPDLTSLALFIRIAETKSITKAAHASHIALAAASRRMSQLEEQYGVQLLHRTAKGVELTPAGSAMLLHARQLMEQADEMRAEYDFSGGERGKYAKRIDKGATMVVLDPDIADAFPTGADVNRALRAILDAIPQRSSRRRSSRTTT